MTFHHGAHASAEQCLPGRPSVLTYSYWLTRCQNMLLRQPQHRSKQMHVAGLLTLFVVVGILDLVLDRNLSFYALYLIPALYGVWFLGVGWGYFSCVASAVVWFIDEMFQQQVYRHTFASYWNLATRAGVLILVVILVKFLKTVLEKQHEIENQQVQWELNTAREVHLRLLPSKAASYRGFDLSYVYEPALMIGADYYDFVPISPDRLAVAVGDISGKGLPGALLMASLQGLIRSNPALNQGHLAALMDGLNASLYELTASNRFATLFFAIIDTCNRSLEYVNAGHNPPLLFRNGPSKTVAVQSLDHAGLPLGAILGSQYECQKVSIQAGDVLVAYTDGVTEAQNSAGEEFGEQRLREVVANALARPAAEISERVRMRLRDFTGHALPFDDLTLVVIKVQSFRSSESLHTVRLRDDEYLRPARSSEDKLTHCHAPRPSGLARGVTSKFVLRNTRLLCCLARETLDKRVLSCDELHRMQAPVTPGFEYNGDDATTDTRTLNGTVLIDAQSARLGAREVFRNLHPSRETRPTPITSQPDLACSRTAHDFGYIVRFHAPIVDPVGEYHDVRREAVASDV
jgi:serine phosphatase RsbU (regulator of sigma subunit)